MCPCCLGAHSRHCIIQSQALQWFDSNSMFALFLTLRAEHSQLVQLSLIKLSPQSKVDHYSDTEQLVLNDTKAAARLLWIGKSMVGISAELGTFSDYRFCLACHFQDETSSTTFLRPSDHCFS